MQRILFFLKNKTTLPNWFLAEKLVQVFDVKHIIHIGKFNLAVIDQINLVGWRVDVAPKVM